MSIPTQPRQAEFDDALHLLVHSTGRPKEKEQQEALKRLLNHLVELCGDDIQRWKMFVLALTQKRYHSLSPAAKEQQQGEKSDERRRQQVHGDGERLFFYIAMEHLIQHSLVASGSSTDASAVPLIDQAVQAMTELAPLAGGSRDLCHLLVALVGSKLIQIDKLTSWKTDHGVLWSKVSLSVLVAQGLCVFQEQANDIKITEKDKVVLKKILRSVADMLDRDLDIVRGAGGQSSTGSTSPLPSTIHVFIPHHERGRKRKNKAARNRRGQAPQTTEPSDRQLFNSVAEILLWSRTRHAQSNPAFTGAHERLLQSAARRDRETAKKQLFTLQTIIRCWRQELNSYARDKGHLLFDQYALDDNKLSSRQINAGKVGDLSKLTRLAGKDGNTRVLRLIALRNELNPSKITKFESISEIVDNLSKVKAIFCGGEIRQLEREIFEKRLQATIEYLRDIAKKHTISQDRPVVVVSMEDSKSDHVAAALMASAYSSWLLPDFDKREKQGGTTGSETAEAKEQHVKLFLSGKECIPGDFEGLLFLLSSIDYGSPLKTNYIPTFMEGSRSATTKALLNFMDRNLPHSTMMVLITKGDIRIPSNYMSSLIARGCSLHVHNVDDMGARLKREGAKKGDITISLAWDTVDDLDLHVFVPSGEELYFQNTGSRDGLCFLDVDMNARVPYSQEPVENIFAGDEDAMIEAPHGHYKVVVQNYAYHEGGPMSEHPVPFRVVVNKNGKKESFGGACTNTGKDSNVTVCEFDYSGRTVPFPNAEEKSVFHASDMVNLTASTGRTIESLGQLVHVAYQQAHLDIVRTLANDNDAENATVEEGTGEVIAMDVEVQEERGVVSGTLEVTNRDRLNMTLAHLPTKFHSIVSQAFDGENASQSPSLAELCATDLAQRMVADRIPIRELRTKGYPDDIVESVKEKMRVFGE